MQIVPIHCLKPEQKQAVESSSYSVCQTVHSGCGAAIPEAGAPFANSYKGIAYLIRCVPAELCSLKEGTFFSNFHEDAL